MTAFDDMYGVAARYIMEQGTSDKGTDVRTVYASDKAPAYTTFVRKISLLIKGDGEVPLLSQKYVFWDAAIKECFKWMWQMKSNRVDDLVAMGVKIWNNWRLPDGTIGKAYGYQLGKRKGKVKKSAELQEMLDSGFLSGCDELDEEHVLLDQVDYLLYKLKTDRSSRRHIVMLWNWDDMSEMSLTPCVYETQWIVEGDKLHLEVGVRSNDWCLGNPFNVFQYYVIWRCIAQVTGYKLGELEFSINIPHVYDRHEEKLKEQLSRPKHAAPTLHINPDVKSFYAFDMEDFKLENYVSEDKIWYEIAE